jgi:hypothetical protein
MRVAPPSPSLPHKGGGRRLFGALGPTSAVAPRADKRLRHGPAAAPAASASSPLVGSRRPLPPRRQSGGLRGVFP